MITLTREEFENLYPKLDPRWISEEEFMQRFILPIFPPNSPPEDQKPS